MFFFFTESVNFFGICFPARHGPTPPVDRFLFSVRAQAEKNQVEYFGETVVGVGQEQEAGGVVPHQQDAEQSAPPTSLPVPPAAAARDSTSGLSTLINHPSPGAPPIVADATCDASRPADSTNNNTRRRVGSETLALHAAVAVGDVSSVEAYIAQNAEKIRRFGAGAAAVAGGGDDGLSKNDETAPATTATATLRPPASGIGAALLVVPGPNSSSPGGGGSSLSPLELVDLRGRTPLHRACVEGRTEVARVLLRAGADANTFDSAG